MAASVLTLSGVNLNAAGGEMHWPDKWTSQRVAQSVTETLGGGLVVFAQTLPAGQHITLEAGEDFGWLTIETVQQVQAMADDAGAQFPLNINGVEYTVMFRHHEPPAFEARPLIQRLNENDGDYFTAIIKLIVI